MSEEVSVDTKAFVKGVERLVDSLPAFSGATALAFDSPKLTSESALASREASSALHLRLLGYEFSDIVVFVTAKHLALLVSKSKVKFLQGCVDAVNARGRLAAQLLVQGKTDGNAKSEVLLALAREAGSPVVGSLLDESREGPLGQAWRSALKASGIPTINCGPGLDHFLAVKLSSELESVEKAAQATTTLVRKVFKRAFQKVLGSDKTVSHKELTKKMDSAISKRDIVPDFDPNLADFIIQPVVQSGGVYNPDFVNLEPYNDLGSVLARTFFVNPSQTQLKAYTFVVDVQHDLVENLKVGAKISDVVQGVLTRAQRKPKWATYLLSNLGCGVGYYLEKCTELVATNDTVIEAGMVFNATVAVKDVPVGPTGKQETAVSKAGAFTVLVADTVAIRASGTDELTRKAAREVEEVSWTVADESSEDEEKKGGRRGRGGAGAKAKAEEVPTLSRAARRAAQAAEMEALTREREIHQKALMEKVVAEGRARVAAMGGVGAAAGAGAREEAQVLAKAPKVRAYPSPDAMPTGPKPGQVFVDKDREAVLIPINGMHVPFAVCTIKTAVKTVEADVSFLRINFVAPGSTFAKDTPASMKVAVARNPDKMFIRTISVKSRDHTNMTVQLRLLKDVQKRIKAKAQAKMEQANLVEQPKLKVDKHLKVPRLQGVSMRPKVSPRGKSEGTLEAHANGLRFIPNASGGASRVEIIYANVKHAIFQPCENEHQVLVHFHLVHPIIINKKRHKDIQFFTNIVDMSTVVDTTNRMAHDPDEYEEEARERALRARLNKMFKQFVERVETIAEKDGESALSQFDIPSRDAGFRGVPQREMVLLQPCTSCLVALTERPPFVLSLDDIEHVHFEGVQFSAKNIDMVVILKPDSVPKGHDGFISISAIPMSQLDGIKAWLNDVVDKTFTEGVNALNWKQVISEIVRDPYFYMGETEDGEPKPVGWEFLMAESDDEDDDDEESESEYKSSGGDEYDDGDDDDDAFDSAVEEEDESDFEEVAEDSGEDWEELEREAAAADRRRAREEKEDAGSRKRRRR